MLLFLLLFIGFAVKVPIVPFHLAGRARRGADADQRPAGGILLKMGGYGLIRLCVTPARWRRCPPLMLVILGVVGVIYGAMLALAQINGDLKKMIAYSRSATWDT